jgi:hypothetical protein
MRSIARRHGLGRGTAKAATVASLRMIMAAAMTCRLAAITIGKAPIGRRSLVFICVGVSRVVCLRLHVVFAVVLVYVYLFVYGGFCLYSCVVVVWLVCVNVCVCCVLLACAYTCL